MDRLFLDANVLFSAAYREGSGLARLWSLADITLLSSRYAAAEARRNLDGPDRRSRLDRLLATVELIDEAPVPSGILTLSGLPSKDRPILAAAVRAEATHLVTGDVRHFGPFFGRSVEGVLIVRPAVYLEGR